MTHPRDLSPEDAHALLADDRRRRLLAVLEANGSATVDELATRIAARETGSRGSADATELEDRVTIGLVHNHLPLLEDHDVVEHDPRTDEVRLMDVYEDLERHVDDEPARTEGRSVITKLLSLY